MLVAACLLEFLCSWLHSCVRSLVPSIQWAKMHAFNDENFILKGIINSRAYFCWNDRFWILKYEQCWRIVSVTPSVYDQERLYFNISHGFTCFPNKIWIKLRKRITDFLKLYQQFQVRVFIIRDPFQWITKTK